MFYLVKCHQFYYHPNENITNIGLSLSSLVHIAVYEGIKLIAIYKVAPPSLESNLQYWEERLIGNEIN